jgi:hypothetical protein
MYLSHVDALPTCWYAWSFSLRLVIGDSLVIAGSIIVDLLVIAGSDFPGISIQSSVLNAYLGSVMLMPLGWLPRGGGGPVQLDMVVRDNFLQSLRKNG